MEIKLALGGRCRSHGTAAVYYLLAAVLLLLLLADATAASTSIKAAVSPDDGNAATIRVPSFRRLSQQGHHGPAAARRLLLAVQPASTAMVGKDTNEFHVEGVRGRTNGKPAREVEFNAGWRRIPGSGSNRNHN